MYSARQQAFEAWYDVYGTQAKKGRYFQALRDPHYVLNDRATNPVPGLHQHINATLFPQVSIYEWTDRDRIKALFLETPKDKVADDGSMHTAIGNYALWLRMTSEDACWVNEPLWDGDDVPAGSGAKSRIKTLNANGFDYLSVLKKHRETYMFNKYLAAIRTKPFILLSGISGTGKSRLVRELARGCCPRYKEDNATAHPLYNEKKPGNFEMIQVRPNWHDSTELVGYVSRITDDGKPKYVLMNFVEFLAKAWTYREVPFFLCLDEMNLAPVEQYFAEYLSVIENREKVTLDVGHEPFDAITTDNLIRWETLEADTQKKAIDELFEDKDWAKVAEHGRVEQVKRIFAADKGIRIPPNLVVMGTVNMDETTCTFSRKVLDRAMSFELNDVADMYDVTKIDGEGKCAFASIPMEAAKGELLTGKDACDADLEMCKKILDILKLLNDGEVDVSDGGETQKKRLLSGTSFKIAYRSRNEILIYCRERTKNQQVSLPKALDEALSMKVLSRIEGDSQKVPKAWLELLKKTIEELLGKLPGYEKSDCNVCADKLRDMAEQAELGYTSFWMR